jgi:ADP-ribose pyrophosphatase YjhB (NUDIX family)
MNCGKFGHSYKVCREPKTSYGIIAVKCLNKEIENQVKKFLLSIQEHFDYQTISYTHENTLEFFSKIKDNIKILLVMRKHTLGYLEFIRGHYNIKEIQVLSFLFQQMTPAEINLIKENLDNFDFLWKDMWSVNNIHNQINENINQTQEVKKNPVKYISHHEYENSKSNFNKLQSNNYKLHINDFIKQTKPIYNCPEWGLPKGRRAHNESDLECARREFSEETGYTKDDYILFENIKPYEENFMGFNGIKYRHIYYIALLTADNEPLYNNLTNSQRCEIGDIGLFNYDEIMTKIRKHHEERKNILHDILINIIKYVLTEIINNFLLNQTK